MSEGDVVKVERLAKFYQVAGDDRCDPIETNTLRSARKTSPIWTEKEVMDIRRI